MARRLSDDFRYLVVAIFGTRRRCCFAILRAGLEDTPCAKYFHNGQRTRSNCQASAGAFATDPVQPQTTRGHAEHALPILPHNFAIGRCSPDSSGNVLHAMSPDHRHNQSGHSKARGLCQIQHANSLDSDLRAAFVCDIQSPNPFVAWRYLSGVPWSGRRTDATL